MSIDSPTVAGWVVATRIRKRRHEFGLDPRSIVERLGISRAYWSRVENDRALLSENMFRQVLDLLRFDETDRDELTALWRIARTREWFADDGDLVGDDLRRFYGLEGGASRLRNFHGSIVDGLLQTDDYTQALIESFPGYRPTDFVRLRRLRASRQQRLLRSSSPPQITVVMGETVLWQRIGGESTLKGQLRHLLSLIDDRSEHLRIRIHPFDRSTGGALAGTPSLVFMDFEGADLPTVAFVEALVSLLLVEKPIEVDQLTVFYEQAFESALDEAETRALIASRL